MSLKHGTYSYEISALAYFLGAIACVFFIFIAPRNAGKPGKLNSLPLVRSIEAGRPGSSQGSAWAVWGPVDISRDGMNIQAEISAAGMDPYGHTWLSGQASITPAAVLQDASGELLSAGEIKALFRKTERLVESGRKAKILDVYSFPFEFWKSQGCLGLLPFTLFDHIQTRGKARHRFIAHKKGPHYVMLEYSSNRIAYVQNRIRLGLRETERPVWPYWSGFAVLLFLSIVKASRASRFPSLIQRVAGILRRMLGIALYGIGPLTGLVIFGYFGMEGENECVHTGISTLMMLGSLGLITAAILIARRLREN